MTGLTVTAVETVNIAGGNYLGATSPALAAAQATKVTTAADLAAKTATVALASQQANAAAVVKAQAATGITAGAIATGKDGLTEVLVTSAKDATTVDLAAQKAAAAAAVAALIVVGGTQQSPTYDASAVVTLAGATTPTLPTGYTAFTPAQYQAAAKAAIASASGSALSVDADIYARATLLSGAADAVNTAVKSTQGDLATAVQLKAAADAVDALTAAGDVKAVSDGTHASVTTFTGVGYTVAQYKAAAAAALKTANGVTLDPLVTADAAAILTRAAVLATKAGEVVTFEQTYGDFTLAQYNSAANGSLSAATGSSLLTNLDDGVAIYNRAVAKDGEATTVLNAANAAVTTASAADIAAGNAVTVALANVTATSVSAAQFADATAIWLSGDSSKTNVTGVAATQTIGLDSLSGLENSITFGSTVTAGSVAVKGSAGTLTVTGAAMTALNVSGTGSTGLAIVDGSTVDTIKTLNLSTSGSTVLTLTAANTGALTTVTQTGAGGVTMVGFDKIASVTTGAGADTLYVETATLADNPGTTIDETINAAVTSGAGNDRLVINTSGTGKLTVDAGEGNDTLYINGFGSGANSISAGAGDDSVRVQTIAGLSTTKVDGGAGVDTLRTTTTAFGATEYVTLTANVTGFETLQTTGVVTALDASKVAFSGFSFLANATVTEVSSTQSIVMARTAAAPAVTGFSSIVAVSEVIPSALVVASKGYLLDSDTVTAGNQTVFGDNLNVTMTNTSATGTVQANGSKLTLAVAALGDVSSTSTTAGANVTGIASKATVSGDLKSIEATLTSARGASSTVGSITPGLEKMAALAVVLDSNGETAAGTQTLLNLSSVKVSGAGTVVIDTRTDLASTAAKLTNIDLSGMTAFANQNEKGQEISNGGTVGGYENLSTSLVTLDNDVAETVVLGGALDTVVTGSTIGAKDTITGFQLTASSANAAVVDLTRSDVLKIGTAFTGNVALGGNGNAGKLVTSATTLEGALLEAGNLKAADGVTNVNNVVFNFGGNTYVYVDNGPNGLSDTDNLVVLSGTLNLDLLLQTGVVIA